MASELISVPVEADVSAVDFLGNYGLWGEELGRVIYDGKWIATVRVY